MRCLLEPLKHQNHCHVAWWLMCAICLQFVLSTSMSGQAKPVWQLWSYSPQQDYMQQNVWFCEHGLSGKTLRNAAVLTISFSYFLLCWCFKSICFTNSNLWGSDLGPRTSRWRPWPCHFLVRMPLFRCNIKFLSLARFLAQEKLARGDGIVQKLMYGLCWDHVGIYIVSTKSLGIWRDIRPRVTLYISAYITAAVLPGYSDLLGLPCLRSPGSSLWQKSWWKILWLRRQELIREIKHKSYNLEWQGNGGSRQGT